MAITFILFFCVAVIFSMLGLGGGIFYVPLLLQIGLTFHEAAAVSVCIMIIMSVTATAVYHLNKLIDWKIVLFMGPCAIIGALIGGLNSVVFSEQLLEILFGIMMLISAVLMFKTPAEINQPKPKKIGFIESRMQGITYFINLWLGVPLFFLAGFIASILGIGGGFAKVPIMTFIFRVPSKVAVATSSALIVLTASAAAAGHFAAGNLDLKLVGILGVAVFAGGYLGSHISAKADKRFINIALAVIMLGVSIWMFYRAYI
ncbi:MAG: sulfite exporter TauE/SafE family protein [Candidatus Goldbacteria bacterium]|nr:sulfite exporter TauE/SafE family protein [Candidatus Goldiibacteriota bacterium]